MTRKAGQRSEATRAALITAATGEFARQGFQKASLRTICSNAGVTTGALYFFFKNKEDLLREVLAPAQEGMEELVGVCLSEGLAPGENGGAGSSAGSTARIEAALGRLYRNHEVVDIVLNSQEAAPVRELTGRVTEKIERQIGDILLEYGIGDPALDECVVRWCAHLRLEAILQLVYCSETRRKAAERLVLMMRFLRGGLAELSRPQ